jgi:flagellar hook assembly protein FlgD
MSPGEHTVVWDGRDEDGRSASSGVYLYRMSSGDYQAVRRMVLMK